MTLSSLPFTLVIFQSTEPVTSSGGFFSATVTPTECSYIMEAHLVPAQAVCVSGGWRALMVRGPLPFSLTGILAAVAEPLAQAHIPIFALSTFDTDYVLVKEEALASAIAVLREAGHEVIAA